MCGGGGGGLSRALNNINNWHPLSNIVDQPVIDPYLQGNLTAKGDVRSGSYVEKKNQNLGLTDAQQAATFFAQTIAPAFGLAALSGTGATGTEGTAGTTSLQGGTGADTLATGSTAPAASGSNTFYGDIPVDPNAGAGASGGATMPAAVPEPAGGATAPGGSAYMDPATAQALGLYQQPSMPPAQAEPSGGTPTQGAQPPQGGATAQQPVQGPQQPGAAQSSTGDSTVDKILKAMKDNPLGTASVAMLGANALAAQPKQNQAVQQQQQISAEAQAMSRQLLEQYRSGMLSASQQAQLDQLTQSTKNQLAQYFASIGQSDSTAARQAIAQVDQQALGMKQQMLDNALSQGLSALGIAAGPLQSVANYQLGQDQQLRNAFGNFAYQVGNVFGRGSGQPQQPQQAPGAPTSQQTMPTQNVQSNQGSIVPQGGRPVG